MEIALEKLPGRCFPAAVRIAADVNRDPLAPSIRLYPVDRARHPIVIELSESVADADVVYASTVMRSGASSTSAAVLVRNAG